MVYDANPAADLDPEISEAVLLWRICRPPPGRVVGMAAGRIPAAGPLPEPGGLLEQGAWLLDAFLALSAAEWRWESRAG